MNTLSALILAVSQWAVSNGVSDLDSSPRLAPAPEIVYVPVETPMVYTKGCDYAKASPDGVVMWCQDEHKILVLATNNKPLE